jgi:uncharacterized phage protein (TIGR01671 family)
MRELKFRAWDKVTKQMSPEFHLFGEFTLIGAVHAWQYESGNTDGDALGRLSDLEIMQFTSLHDKNGKEIYGGDIVEVANTPEDEEPGSHDVTTTCVFERGQFLLMDSFGGSWTRQLYHQPERLTITGNIYENSDLL